MNTSMKSTTAILAGITALLLTGCNVGPKYQRPAVTAPSAFRGPDEAAVSSNAKDSLGDEQWSAVFREPELQDLIRQALENNYDLRIAAERVLEARSQIRITRAAGLPTLTVGGTGVGADLPNSLTSSLGGSNSLAGDNPLSFGSINLSAAWTPDFWGLYRKQTEAARDQMLAQAWAQRAVRMTLVGQVATSYFTLRSLDQQLEVAKQTLKARQDSLDLTKRLEQGGSAPLSDVREAEQLLYTASAEIPQLQEQIQQQENTMSLLLGKPPGSVAHTDPSALSPVPQDLPVGIPSQLLERRPDIQQAEAQLKAANAQVGVAKAQFFPQLSISASAGVGGDSLSSIFDSNSKTIYGLGTLTQPIFEGGKLRGQYELSKQQKEELILTYQKTILTAFRDVSNSLIAVNKQHATRTEQQKLVEAAQDATRLARLRYEGGSTAYLEVLTTDTNLFNVQLNLINAEQSEALALVQLYQALGGGWQQ
ncbi:efflux transporter outer membrane subunit [Acidicapsa dinghuensis]|uniref:Efflux transporter outer membrane subunit n=1 Tax=Acidicapsa dinghuensis TaxID=2218256 RepID=A0ABW1EGQ7_9BACT|nr:efflux transporter outer membrane subunit [Acidicapsa dinghuensis]